MYVEGRARQRRKAIEDGHDVDELNDRIRLHRTWQRYRAVFKPQLRHADSVKRWFDTRHGRVDQPRSAHSTTQPIRVSSAPPFESITPCPRNHQHVTRRSATGIVPSHRMTGDGSSAASVAS